MARFLKLKKENIGISPDAFLFRGEKKIDFVKLRLIDYNLDHIAEIDVAKIKEIENYKHTNSTSWFNIDGLHDEKIMNEISEYFSLDSLIIPDVLNTDGRPKIHEYDNCVFLSTKMLKYEGVETGISTENLSVIIKKDMVISFQERMGDVFEPVRERIRKGKIRIRSSGPDYLAFALLDVVIDNYIYVISRIGDQIENIDNELISNPGSEILSKINKYKAEINFLAKTIKPCREMIFNLVKLDTDFLNKKITVHLKELQDNINLANDSIDSYREILNDQLNIFHSNVSNKLNDILKVLTIFSVVFIPLSFIAGIYGTNFNYIPLAQYKYGYFVMWGIILLIALLMIFYFKRKKWF